MDETDPLAPPLTLDTPTDGGHWRMVTTWWASDASVAEGLAWINSLPQSEPLRHEAEAGIHMLQARWAWAEADRLRRAERYRRTPRVAGPDDGRRQVAKGRCQMCCAQVRLRLDGTVRVHDTGSGAAAPRTRDGATGRCIGAGLPPVA